MNTVAPVRSIDPVVLTVAHNTEEVNIPGTFIHCLSASEPFLVAINKGGDTVELSSNRSFRMPADTDGNFTEFTAFMVRRSPSAALASNSILLLVGSGEFRDNNVAARSQVATTLNGGIADKAPVATGGANATLLIAASVGSVRAAVKVRNTGTVPLRIAGTDADARAGGKGDYVEVGEAVVYDCAGALYAAGVGGVGACAVVELLW